jgi:hypothetical protein
MLNLLERVYAEIFDQFLKRADKIGQSVLNEFLSLFWLE